MRGFIWVSVLALWFIACSAQEVTVTEKEVPEPILTAFRDMFPDAKVREFCREVEDGKILYEISFTFEEAEYDVTYTPEGTIDAIEKTISIETLPEEVAKAIKKKLPQSKIYIAEEIIKGDKIYYEVKVVTASGKKEKKYELLFSEDGKLIEEEYIKGEEDS